MNYKNLGNTDIKVSTICLGTMTWGEQNTELEAFEQMDFALDQGVNFWDTAELMRYHQERKPTVILRKLLGTGLKKQKKETKSFLQQKLLVQQEII